MLKRVTRPRVWRNALYFPIGLYSYGHSGQVLAVVYSQLRDGCELTGGGAAPVIVEGVVARALKSIGAFWTC